MVFNSYAISWNRSRTLHAATEENVKAAQSFISALVAGGNTNIDAALTLAIDIFNDGESMIATILPYRK